MTHEVHVIWAFLLALITPIYLKTVKDSKDHHPEKGFNPALLTRYRLADNSNKSLDNRISSMERVRDPITNE